MEIIAITTNATAADPRVGDVHGSRSTDCTITVPMTARATGRGCPERSRRAVAINASEPGDVQGPGSSRGEHDRRGRHECKPRCARGARRHGRRGQPGEHVIGDRSPDRRASRRGAHCGAHDGDESDAPPIVRRPCRQRVPVVRILVAIAGRHDPSRYRQALRRRHARSRSSSDAGASVARCGDVARANAFAVGGAASATEAGQVSVGLCRLRQLGRSECSELSQTTDANRPS